MYSQFLANTFPAPTTIRNYISGAKSWVLLHEGDLSAFLAPELATMAKAIKEKSLHVASPAPPLTPAHIRLVCEYIDSVSHIPLAVKPAILLAYVCFFRASNVVSPTLNQWGGPHTLVASDVVSIDGGLHVTVRSTKTRSRSAPHTVLIFPAFDAQLCPVRAWLHYKSVVNPCPIGPAFMLGPSTPLTAQVVVVVIRAALKKAGVDNSAAFTFHSLR